MKRKRARQRPCQKGSRKRPRKRDRRLQGPVDPEARKKRALAQACRTVALMAALAG